MRAIDRGVMRSAGCTGSGPQQGRGTSVAPHRIHMRWQHPWAPHLEPQPSQCRGKVCLKGAMSTRRVLGRRAQHRHPADPRFHAVPSKPSGMNRPPSPGPELGTGTHAHHPGPQMLRYDARVCAQLSGRALGERPRSAHCLPPPHQENMHRTGPEPCTTVMSNGGVPNSTVHKSIVDKLHRTAGA